jgi:hypothetical protein
VAGVVARCCRWPTSAESSTCDPVVLVSLRAQPTAAAHGPQLRRPVLALGRERTNTSCAARQDALTSAAYAVVHCHGLTVSPSGEPRAAVRAAKEVMRWLELLDLLKSAPSRPWPLSPGEGFAAPIANLSFGQNDQLGSSPVTVVLLGKGSRVTC